MQDFDSFFSQKHGPSLAFPPPIQYSFVDYVDQVTSSPINGTEEGSTYELKPIQDEDMARYAADDVVQHYTMMHQGKSPSRLGNAMSDEQLKKHMGHTW